MRLAIIGGGVSGAGVRAHASRRARAGAVRGGRGAGGHANTVRVETEAGGYDVDMGFIVFNDRNYPNFERLLDELEVATPTVRR